MTSRTVPASVSAFACLILVAACGGIPIWPNDSPAPAPSAVAAAAPAASGPSAAASPAESSTPIGPPPASTRAGIAVLAIGPVAFSTDETGARKLETGREVFSATRALAKQLYAVPRLRPHADEGTVSALAGVPTPPDAAAALREISELRASLTPDLESATSRALLESLGRKVDVEGLVVVSAAPGGATQARLLRVEGSPDGGVTTHLEGAIFAATEGPPATAGEGPSYSWNATSIASLLGPPSKAGPGKGQGPEGALGPRRDSLPSAKTATAPGKTQPKSKADEKKSKNIFESPWFWVAAGGLAAIGVTALVVSQTVDTHSGSVNLQGKVLP